jgi:glycosyltransferase involved in cell wall biosynthesis
VLYASLVVLRALTRHRADVVVACSPPALIAAFLVPVKWLRRWPAVYEVRDMMADSLAANHYLRNGLLVRLAGALDRFTTAHYRQFIAISPGTRRLLMERGIPEDAISVVPNGYIPELFDGRRPDWEPRERFGWGQRFVIIYAGGLTQSYDIPTLLRASERLQGDPNALFVLMGSGDRQQEYIDYVASHRLTNVQFLPPHPRSDMPHILSAVNAGVSLFRDDPIWSIVLNNKIFDYLGSALPVLYAGTGDSAELLEASNGGIVVPPEDDAALAQAIQRLMADRAQARQMGERGREYVRQHYEMDRLLERYEARLQTAVSVHRL